MELLRFLTEELQEARILVFATYRDIDVSEGQPLTAVLQSPCYPPQVQRIALAGPSEEEIGQLIEALGHAGSAALAARIHEDRAHTDLLAVGERHHEAALERGHEAVERQAAPRRGHHTARRVVQIELVSVTAVFEVRAAQETVRVVAHGNFTRVESYMRSLKQAPFWQPRGLKSATSGRTCG